MGILLLISCMVLVLGSCEDKKTDMTEVADRVEKMVTGNNPLQVKTVSQDKYAYSTLDDATKLVYDEILYAIVHRKEEVQIATTDVEQMELAYLAVRYDYCDLFWLKQFSYVTYSRDDEITAIEITPEYSMTAAERHRRRLIRKRTGCWRMHRKRAVIMKKHCMCLKSSSTKWIMWKILQITRTSSVLF